MWWFGGCRFIVLAFCGCVVLSYLLDSGLGCCMACVCVLVCGWFWGGGGVGLSDCVACGLVGFPIGLGCLGGCW